MIINIEIFVEDGVYNRLKRIPPLSDSQYENQTARYIASAIELYSIARYI